MNTQERTKEQLLNDLRQSEFEISELKKAEDNYEKIAEALNQERELYADLTNALPSGIYRLRVFHDVSLIDKNWSSSSDTPYVIEFANDCFFEILNLDRLGHRPPLRQLKVQQYRESGSVCAVPEANKLQ